MICFSRGSLYFILLWCERIIRCWNNTNNIKEELRIPSLCKERNTIDMTPQCTNLGSTIIVVVATKQMKYLTPLNKGFLKNSSNSILRSRTKPNMSTPKVCQNEANKGFWRWECLGKFVAIFSLCNLFARHKQSRYLVSILEKQPPLPIYGPHNAGQLQWLPSLCEQVANGSTFPQPRWRAYSPKRNQWSQFKCGQGSSHESWEANFVHVMNNSHSNCLCKWAILMCLILMLQGYESWAIIMHHLNLVMCN